MLLHLKHLLGPHELPAIQAALGDDAPWRDGSSSAGSQALAHKNNQQLAQDSTLARALQAQVLARRDLWLRLLPLPAQEQVDPQRLRRG